MTGASNMSYRKQSRYAHWRTPKLMAEYQALLQFKYDYLKHAKEAKSPKQREYNEWQAKEHGEKADEMADILVKRKAISSAE